MPHLYKFRKGWQSEHLARYILSKFSFVAVPSNISDDLGSDFFCTLFKIQDNKYLMPQSSFAIQIKSNEDNFDITNKNAYLGNLELPFFVGAIDKKAAKLIIYSGEFLSYFHALWPVGKEDRVFVKLVEKRNIKKPYSRGRNNIVYLHFPKLVEIDTNFDYAKNESHLNGLFEVCKLMRNNISSKIMEEHLYEFYKSTSLKIVTGPGSAKVYESNFYKRLAEVFCNLKWLYENPNIKKDNLVNDFKMYEKIFKQLEANKNLPTYLVKLYESALNVFT